MTPNAVLMTIEARDPRHNMPAWSMANSAAPDTVASRQYFQDESRLRAMLGTSAAAHGDVSTEQSLDKMLLTLLGGATPSA
jgi:hypothetical protein